MAKSRFGEPWGSNRSLPRNANAGHHCGEMENHYIMESEHADEKVQ